MGSREMNYEQKYKESMLIAEHHVMNGALSQDEAEALFPELRESEDERIRKWLYDYISNCPNNNFAFYGGVGKDAVLNYLEKQKEHKDYRKLYEDIAKSEWFKKAYVGKSLGEDEQKEQKPVEWEDEYREEDLRTRFAFYTYKNEEDDSVLYLSNVFVEEASRNAGFGTKILEAAEKVAETIGAITIRLKVKQDSPANAWYRKRGYGYIAFEGEYDWLEKNLEYLKPKRNKQERVEGLEEEDEKTMQDLIDLLWIIQGSSNIKPGTASKYGQWLKSIRPSWKPSEEQMEALHNACYAPELEVYGAMTSWLKELYEQLKKL